MRVQKRRIALLSLAVIFVLFLVLLGNPIVWQKYGEALVRDEPPRKSDAILVLAGGQAGVRILHAAQLAKRGFAPVVFVSGPVTIYGSNEADLSIAYAVASGYPPEMFQAGKFPATSTEEEALAWREFLLRRGVHRLLLVTSDYHTARAYRTFHLIIPELEIHTSAAPDPAFARAEGWWHSREGRKTFAFETIKSVAHATGL